MWSRVVGYLTSVALLHDVVKGTRRPGHRRNRIEAFSAEQACQPHVFNVSVLMKRRTDITTSGC